VFVWQVLPSKRRKKAKRTEPTLVSFPKISVEEMVEFSFNRINGSCIQALAEAALSFKPNSPFVIKPMIGALYRSE
jgi:hypothetical protein